MVNTEYYTVDYNNLLDWLYPFMLVDKSGDPI